MDGVRRETPNDYRSRSSRARLEDSTGAAQHTERPTRRKTDQSCAENKRCRRGRRRTMYAVRRTGHIYKEEEHGVRLTPDDVRRTRLHLRATRRRSAGEGVAEDGDVQ